MGIHCETGRNNLLDFPFTPKEVQVRISSLKSGKCSGVDLIPNEFIKISADIFLPILVKLFNKVLQTSSNTSYNKLFRRNVKPLSGGI